MHVITKSNLSRAALGALLGLVFSTAAFAQTTTTTPPPPKATTTTPPAKTTTPPKTTTGTGAAATGAGTTAGAKPATGAAGSTAKTTTPPAAGSTAKTTTPAGTATAAATPADSADAPDTPWAKICGNDPQTKKPVCVLTASGAPQANGAPLVTIRIFKVDELSNKYGIQMFLPQGLMLPPGIVMAVDGGSKKTKAAFQACAPMQGLPLCIAEAAADGPFMDGLRKGKVLNLTLVLPGNKENKIDVPLTAFAKVMDSAGIDEATAQAKQAELTQALQKRAEERRQKLIDEQNKQSSAATIAPATTAKQ